MAAQSLSIEGITKSFGATPVLNGIDLDIRAGEFITLVGPSGCGKSTLLRLIAGLETPDSGTIALNGVALDGTAPRNRDLAMVFQSYALYPHLTVAQNLAVPLVMRELNGWQRLPFIGGFMPGSRSLRTRIEGRLREVARSLEIEALLERKPGQLSGGQRQRVALGRAIIREPAAFLMDEPLSNLDAKLRVTMRAEISELHRRLDTTFVYVTHDQAEAMTMASRIAVMMEGDLLQVAEPEEIYRRPADIRVAEFIGSPRINILPCTAEPDGELAVLGRTTGLMAAGATSIGIRPEAVLPARDGFRARVRHKEMLGPEVFYQLGVEGLDTRMIMRCESLRDPRLALGETLAVTIDAQTACAFDATGRAVAVRLHERLRKLAHA